MKTYMKKKKSVNLKKRMKYLFICVAESHSCAPKTNKYCKSSICHKVKIFLKALKIVPDKE